MKLLDVKTDPSAVFRRTFLLEFPFMVTMVSRFPQEGAWLSYKLADFSRNKVWTQMEMLTAPPTLWICAYAHKHDAFYDRGSTFPLKCFLDDGVA